MAGVAKFSSTQSLSLASSANRAALLTTFAAWAAVWRAVAEEHADQLQTAVKAAAVWRSQMRSGKFVKDVANTDPVIAPCEVPGEEVKVSLSQGGDLPVEDDHAAELQRALEAASAWRSKIRSAGSSSKAATTQPSQISRIERATSNSVDAKADLAPIASVPVRHNDDLNCNLPDSPSRQEIPAAHDAELQAALDAAAKWRSRLQSNHKAKENKIESESPSQQESPHEPSPLCDSSAKKKCASPLAAILTGDVPDNDSTTASSDEGGCASSNSSEGAPTCWVQGAFLRDVSRILADGLRSKGPRVRLYAGPWGRSGLCRRNEEVLVYIDVPKARRAGAEFRFVPRGLVLVAGAIPAACCRKMVMIKDGTVLFDRNSVEPESA